MDNGSIPVIIIVVLGTILFIIKTSTVIVLCKKHRDTNTHLKPNSALEKKSGLKDIPPKSKIEHSRSEGSRPTIEVLEQGRWESCKHPGISMDDKGDAPKPSGLNYIQVDVKVNPKSNSKPRSQGTNKDLECPSDGGTNVVMYSAVVSTAGKDRMEKESDNIK